MLLSMLWVCLLSLLPALVSAQGQFTNPDGNSNDLSQSYVVGSTAVLTWKGGWEGIGTKQDFVDLFLTSFDDGTFLSLLAKNVSLEQDGSIRWTVDVPKDQIAHSKNFVLRFVQARTPPSFSDAAAVAMSPSRGFVLQQSSASISSAIASGTASASNSTSAPTSSTLAAATKEKSSTPIGAIVGGVVGGLVLIALGVVGFLLFRVLQRRKISEKDAVEAPADSTYYPPSSGYTDTAPKYEHAAPRHEGSAQELQAGGELYEADTRYGSGR